MDVVAWLLDSDPAIRWQVMRDLTDGSDDTVAAERAKIADEGWGARLLDLQASDGQWGGGTYVPLWTSTAYTLSLLRILGVDPADERVRRAVALVDENSTWEYDDLPFFSGEVEPCINGMAVALGAYFGPDVRGIVDRLLGEQMTDGGWNCAQEQGSKRGSFHTTICVLEGLLAYERATGVGSDLADARTNGHEYLLERRLFRRLSTGAVVDRDWTRFSFPTYYFYDVLRGLDYLRAAGVVPDERMAEAIGLVEQKRTADGRWLLESPHPGEVHLDFDETEGAPSWWNTLRAMRVLRWYEQS